MCLLTRLDMSRSADEALLAYEDNSQRKKKRDDLVIIPFSKKEKQKAGGHVYGFVVSCAVTGTVVAQRTRLVNGPKSGVIWNEHRLQRSQLSCGIAMTGG